MSDVWPAPLRDPRPNQHDRTVPKLQWRGHSSDPKHLTSTTSAFAEASESAQNRRKMGPWPASNRHATLLDCSRRCNRWHSTSLDCSRCNRWHSTSHRWQTHSHRNVHLPLRESDDQRHQNLPCVRSTLSVNRSHCSGGGTEGSYGQERRQNFLKPLRA